MAETRPVSAALQIEAPSTHSTGSGSADAEPDGDELEGHVAAFLTDFHPVAIQDLAELPLPPGSLWDPTFPPIPEPPPAPLRWRAFFQTPDDRDRAHTALHARFPNLALAALDVPDEDWAARSQRALTAVHAGRFIVAPPWAVPSSPHEQILIVIEPSMGFGTGHHPTTRLCLRALSALNLKSRSVIDLGTGSGVLAIAAALSGAAVVVGLDVDPDAIGNARHNGTLNRAFVPPVFEIADFREQTIRAADIVLANLTGGMLRSAAESVRGLVSPGGTLIVSGFDETECAAVRDALGPWSHETSASEDGWVALTLSDAQ